MSVSGSAPQHFIEIIINLVIELSRLNDLPEIERIYRHPGCRVKPHLDFCLSWRPVSDDDTDLAIVETIPLSTAEDALTWPGWTPLMHAVRRECLPIVNILLDHHANPQAVNSKKFTPLMIACRYGSIESAKLLIQAGVDVNYETPQAGWSALIIAAIHNRVNLVLLLLNSGAEMEVSDRHYSTMWSALEWAAHHENYRIVKMIVDYKQKLRSTTDGNSHPQYDNLSDVGYLLEHHNADKLADVSSLRSVILSASQSIKTVLKDLDSH